MKRHLQPGILLSGVALIAIIFILNTALGVDILSGNPGDTITYQGHGSPGSVVSLEVTASESVGVVNGSYSGSLSGVNVPSGENSLSMTVSPVSTMNITGKPSWRTGSGLSLPGTVSGNTGSFAMANAPGGSYDIGVEGVAAPGASSVTMVVTVAQPVTVGSDGSYAASIDTSGLPAGVYTVRQGGQDVARVYLGVTPPVTVTPNPQASTSTPASGPATTPIPPASTPAVTQQPVEILPTAAAATEVPVTPTMSQSTGLGPGQAALALALALIVLVAALAYLGLRRNKKR